jgi:hypothetical protein
MAKPFSTGLFASNGFTLFLIKTVKRTDTPTKTLFRLLQILV